jgi:hypothetical protein
MPASNTIGRRRIDNSPHVQALAEPTLFAGLGLAGMPEE